MTKDTLTLRDERGVLQPISLADVGRVELSRKRVGHPNLGGGLGLGVGAVVGGVIGSLTFSDPGPAPLECAGSFLCDQPTRLGHTLGGATYGGLIGGALGALIGSNVKTDRWTTISTSSLEPMASVRPTSNGGAVVTFAFRF